MDDLESYLSDLKRVKAMNFDSLILVHTLDYSRDSIVVDSEKKLSDYIHYREEKLK